MMELTTQRLLLLLLTLIICVTTQPSQAFTPAFQDDPTLASLTFSVGRLNSTFAATTLGYTLGVPPTTTNVTLTPTTTAAIVQSIQWSLNNSFWTNVAPGSASGMILVTDTSVIYVKVVSQDGTQSQTYTVTVKSNDSFLSSIAFNAGSLAPTYSAITLSYLLIVPGATTTVTVTPTLRAANAATIILVGLNYGSNTTVASGGSKGPITIIPDTDVITISVLAPDGFTVVAYDISIVTTTTADARLALVTFDLGLLTTTFLASQTTYTVSTAPAVTSMLVTAITAASTVTSLQWSIDNSVFNPLTSGSPSGAIPVTVGTTLIYIKCLAQDGTTSKTYTFTLLSNDVSLSNLTSSVGSLSPAFSGSTSIYTLSVPVGTNTLTVTPTKSGGSIRIGKNNAGYATVASGSASLAQSPLVLGVDVISIVVVASDGFSSQTYFLLVKCDEPGLSSLGFSTGVLTASFLSTTANYTLSVVPTTTALTIIPSTIASVTTLAWSTNNITWSFTGNGVSTPIITVTAGVTTIYIKVVAQDRRFFRLYTIAVQSNDATLSGLSPSVGKFLPNFIWSTTNYILSVPTSTSSIQLLPTKLDGTILVGKNGGNFTNCPSGILSTVQSGLIVGKSYLTVKVIAADGFTTQLYTLNLESNDATLYRLLFNLGTLTPSFSSTTFTYALELDPLVTAIQMLAIPANLGTVVQYSLDNYNYNPLSVALTSVPVTVDVTLISIQLTAVDGATTHVYQVSIKTLATSSIIVTPTDQYSIVTNELPIVSRLISGGDWLNALETILVISDQLNVILQSSEVVGSTATSVGQNLLPSLLSTQSDLLTSTNTAWSVAELSLQTNATTTTVIITRVLESLTLNAKLSINSTTLSSAKILCQKVLDHVTQYPASLTDSSLQSLGNTISRLLLNCAYLDTALSQLQQLLTAIQTGRLPGEGSTFSSNLVTASVKRIFTATGTTVELSSGQTITISPPPSTSSTNSTNHTATSSSTLPSQVDLLVISFSSSLSHCRGLDTTPFTSIELLQTAGQTLDMVSNGITLQSSLLVSPVASNAVVSALAASQCDPLSDQDKQAAVSVSSACGWWDATMNSYSTLGCTKTGLSVIPTTNSSQYLLSCTCNHVAEFATLYNKSALVLSGGSVSCSNGDTSLGSIAFLILGIFYLVLTLVAMIQLNTSRFNHGWKKFWMLSGVHLVLILTGIVRFVDVYIMYSLWSKLSPQAEAALLAFPSLFYSWIHSFILLCWSSILHTSEARIRPGDHFGHYEGAFIIGNVLVSLAFVLIFFFIIALSDDSTTMTHLVQTCSGLLIGVQFLFTYCVLTGRPPNHGRFLPKTETIVMPAIFGAMAMFCGSAIIQIIILSETTSFYNTNALILNVFYYVLDICGLFLVLIFFSTAVKNTLYLLNDSSSMNKYNETGAFSSLKGSPISTVKNHDLHAVTHPQLVIVEGQPNSPSFDRAKLVAWNHSSDHPTVTSSSPSSHQTQAVDTTNPHLLLANLAANDPNFESVIENLHAEIARRKHPQQQQQPLEPSLNQSRGSLSHAAPEFRSPAASAATPHALFRARVTAVEPFTLPGSTVPMKSMHGGSSTPPYGKSAVASSPTTVRTDAPSTVHHDGGDGLDGLGGMDGDDILRLLDSIRMMTSATSTTIAANMSIIHNDSPQHHRHHHHEHGSGPAPTASSSQSHSKIGSSSATSDLTLDDI